MCEAQVGFLYKIASILTQNPCNQTQDILKSYYLMQCKKVTKGYGLPKKYFSTEVRCSKCCVEWKKDTEVKVKSIKTNKSRRRRIRKKSHKRHQGFELLHSNEIEQICSFCKNSNITQVLKPIKCELKKESQIISNKKVTTEAVLKDKKNKKETQRNNSKSHSQYTRKISEINVYTHTNEVFSLQNQNNSIKKEEPVKVVKNSKKKKDKFAGLSRHAVLAAAKLREETLKQDKTSKLSLFLKPSS